jgi:hypothetical protein
VYKAEIQCPDGKAETMTNLAADRFCYVREGDDPVSFKSAELGRAKQA